MDLLHRSNRIRVFEILSILYINVTSLELFRYIATGIEESRALHAQAFQSRRRCMPCKCVLEVRQVWHFCHRIRCSSGCTNAPSHGLAWIGAGRENSGSTRYSVIRQVVYKQTLSSSRARCACPRARRRIHAGCNVRGRAANVCTCK